MKFAKHLSFVLLVGIMISAGVLFSVSAEKTTVTFVTLQDLIPNLQPVVNAYEKENPNVNVKLEGYPFNQLFEVIETKMKAHSNDVDILNVDAPLITNYSVKGYLEPLDSYFGKASKDEFLKSTITAASYKGKFMAAPLNSSSVGMYYNVDLFKKYGVAEPSLNPEKRWTWEEVVAAAQKLTHSSEGIWGLAFDQFSQPYQMLPLAQSLGGRGVSPNGLKASGYLNAKPWIKAAQFYQDLFQKYKVSPLGVAAFQSPELFKSGKVAMLVTGPWHVNNFKSAQGLHWAYAPHPYFAGGKAVTPTGSWHVSISKNSLHKKEAADFVKFLTLREGNQIYFDGDGNLPANKYTLQYAQKQATTQGNQVMSLAIYEAEHTAMARPSTPGYLEWETAVAQAFEDIRNGGDPKKVLDKAAQQIDLTLAKYGR
ncbi:MAG TPA: sugar ABC transporter substrate-binding protein [Bacillota bacterium]